MTRIFELEPKQRNNIMDLVQIAGVDVGDWKNFRKGVDVNRANRNPRYCYSWSFVEASKVVVLNLWHRELREVRGTIVQNLDRRKQAEAYQALGTREGDAWERRAIQMDQSVQIAIREDLPIRVVVCDGKMRTIATGQKASQVQKRLLDDAIWGVASYDWSTGRCTVVRGIGNDGASALTEQMPKIPEEIGGVVFQEGAKTRIVVNAYERDERARNLCLQYWGPTCAICGMSFEEAYGKYFRGLIHVHHLRPLSTLGPNYSVDPVKDLRPVCPNCHAAIHYRKTPPYLVEEIQHFLESSRARTRRRKTTTPITRSDTKVR